MVVSLYERCKKLGNLVYDKRCGVALLATSFHILRYIDVLLTHRNRWIFQAQSFMRHITVVVQSPHQCKGGDQICVIILCPKTKSVIIFGKNNSMCCHE